MARHKREAERQGAWLVFEDESGQGLRPPKGRRGHRGRTPVITVTARRYRTIEIQAGRQAITAADPIPDDLRQALEAINSGTRGAH